GGDIAAAQAIKHFKNESRLRDIAKIGKAKLPRQVSEDGCQLGEGGEVPAGQREQNLGVAGLDGLLPSEPDRGGAGRRRTREHWAACVQAGRGFTITHGKSPDTTVT